MLPNGSISIKTLISRGIRTGPWPSGPPNGGASIKTLISRDYSDTTTTITINTMITIAISCIRTKNAANPDGGHSALLSCRIRANAN